MAKASKRGVIESVAGFLVLTGCLFSPESDDNPPDPIYYEPADSAWKVVKNLETAYINRDHDAYMDCFREDFEFHLLETDWDDYDGDGIVDTYWGYDIEDLFSQNMFNAVEQIELVLTGTSEYPWMGDPTEQSYALPRNFDLKVYTSVGGPSQPPQGYRASGEAIFICRPDTTTGEWYIWQWFDESEV